MSGKNAWLDKNRLCGGDTMNVLFRKDDDQYYISRSGKYFPLNYAGTLHEIRLKYFPHEEFIPVLTEPWMSKLIRFIGKKVTLIPGDGFFTVTDGKREVSFAYSLGESSVKRTLAYLQIEFSEEKQNLSPRVIVEKLDLQLCECGKVATHKIVEGVSYTTLFGTEKRVYPSQFVCEGCLRAITMGKTIIQKNSLENPAEPCKSPAGSIGFFSIEDANKRRSSGKRGGNRHKKAGFLSPAEDFEE